MFASLKREFLPKGSQLMIEDKNGKNLYRSFKSGGYMADEDKIWEILYIDKGVQKSILVEGYSDIVETNNWKNKNPTKQFVQIRLYGNKNNNAKGGYMVNGGMLYKNWDMENGEVTYKGKLVTRYYYDNQVDVFFLDIVKGGRGYAIGFKDKTDAYDYLSENKNLWKFAYGGMMAKGGKISRNKNKNDWKNMFDFFVENNYQPIGKRDLINMAYDSSNGIDSAIPQSMVGDVDNTAYYVYDYQTDKMGELVDLRTKLKFSNVKVDVTIVQDGELKYRDELPSELQNATFHQALNYVFTHDDVDQFAIRPKK
jgi:hypothetical protein